ncbi:hypothetical protein CS0771_30320 [Catellatospora sp. IY07-71]|uniref:phosphotransferase n=1 Tax=Catellatospora sp. IY07-71 TaxID=2728827 RepID=UPI001BB30069|nr:phosphotransferase [Catellatospora sp. IY07-71]BCJ73488.1 hypothetical protein CS0771_30320 [Catellatospora sp. IY07-71]
MRAGQDEDRQRLAQVCAAFGLGDVHAVRHLPIGAMNRNWRVDTTTGVYAVKELQDRNAGDVGARHRTMKLLIGHGVPVPEPLERAGGDPECVLDGARFTVSAWAPGQHLTGTAMSLDQAAAYGELLGGIHVALSAVPLHGGAPPDHVPDATLSLTALDVMLDLVTRRPDRDEIDELALSDLARRRELLTAPTPPVPAGAEPGPRGWVHGDFHHNNVLWEQGRVSAVLDWDRVGVRSLAAELIRACLLTFGGDGGIDLPRTAAFADGYRRRRPLTVGQLADAEHRAWWSWLTGSWPLDRRYQHGDTTCDRFYVRNAATFRWWTDNRTEVVAALTGRVAH